MLGPTATNGEAPRLAGQVMTQPLTSLDCTPEQDTELGGVGEKLSSIALPGSWCQGNCPVHPPLEPALGSGHYLSILVAYNPACCF